MVDDAHPADPETAATPSAPRQDAGASAAGAPAQEPVREPEREAPRLPQPIVAPVASAPETLGALVGPEAGVFGSRLGLTFEHHDELLMLLADAWADERAACPSDAGMNDDRVARLPRALSAGVPALELGGAEAMMLFREGAAVNLGFGQSAIAGFSDGDRAFALFGGDATAELEIGIAREDDLAKYDTVLRRATEKFAQPALRAVATFEGRSARSDYRDGHDALLVWGRPALAAEHGRQSPLYLMWHSLPLALDESGRLKFEPHYFAGLDADGEPRWSNEEASAQPIALDGRESGDPHELAQISGHMAIAWLAEPISKWVMLYGGDLPDAALRDPASARSKRAPGAILMRFADRPWGPFTPPQPHLIPGAQVVFSQQCRASEDVRCAKGNPARCSAPLLERGRLYGPNVIDAYTGANAAGGVDLVWSVSTWNPYGIQLMRTRVVPGPAAAGARELSDERGLERLSDWSMLPRLGEKSRYRQQSSYERGTQGDLWALSRQGNRDYNNFLCASADAMIAPQLSPIRYDRQGCEESYVRGAVMARFVGAGRHVRSWIAMTSLKNGAGGQILRLYIDDDPTPRVEAPLAELLDGRAGETFAPPFGAGSALRLSWYYPVAFQKKFIAALDRLADDDHFYHWDVMLDETAKAASATPHASWREAAAAQLSAVYHPAGTLEPLMAAESISLEAGKVRRFELQGPATIGELRVRLAEIDYRRLAEIRVRMRWDEQAETAVDVSLLELLGNGRVAPEQSTQALTSFLEDGVRTLGLKLPMPYAKAAAIELENTGATALTFELEVAGERQVPVGEFGRLHVQRRETVGPTQLKQHVAVEASGVGRLVGVCAFIEGVADPEITFGHLPLNALEGDVRARIDGESALQGTGTEEYADDIYYFAEAPQASPFVQAWGVEGNVSPGCANLCRWHVLGTELDYASSIQLTFDLGGSQNPELVRHLRTVAYLYQ